MYLSLSPQVKKLGKYWAMGELTLPQGWGKALFSIVESPPFPHLPQVGVGGGEGLRHTTDRFIINYAERWG